MASSYVGGLSGAFIPVSEDQGMIDAVKAGALTLEKLEAMTCVCSVGLDMIAVPGDTSAETISAIIADEAAIASFSGSPSPYHSMLRRQLAQPLGKFTPDEFTAEFIAEALLTWTVAGRGIEDMLPLLEKLL